jgi:hypothetical protein
MNCVHLDFPRFGVLNTSNSHSEEDLNSQYSTEEMLSKFHALLFSIREDPVQIMLVAFYRSEW